MEGRMEGGSEGMGGYGRVKGDGGSECGRVAREGGKEGRGKGV